MTFKTKLVPVHNIKCTICGDFNSKYVVIMQKTNLFIKDDIWINHLCNKCKRERWRE